MNCDPDREPESRSRKLAGAARLRRQVLRGSIISTCAEYHQTGGHIVRHRVVPMFSVIFEVLPRKERFDEYLALAKRLRPILETIDGFVDTERFESRGRPGWILSHSTWRDEKSVVRWRTTAEHDSGARPLRGASGLSHPGRRRYGR
jgi:heme-degrading monooxygenase HmoA